MQYQCSAIGSAERYERVTVVVPAHNEADGISDTIISLLTQTRLPDRVVVVSDNSTNATIEIARSFGGSVECIETVGNIAKKAGALNWALEYLNLPDDTYVLIVDADTQLSPVWIETALSTFDSQSNVGAIGGVFLGDDEPGLVSDMERLEYGRYARELKRLKGSARVLTGTSSMFRMSTLREVRDARAAGKLPGAGFYDHAITEDFSQTIAIKRLGYKTVSPASCTVTTETMNTVPMLWKQRVRWSVGAFDTLWMHGFNRVTLPYWWRQVETLLGITANVTIWALAAYLAATSQFHWSAIWIAVGMVFYVERIHSAIGSGKKGVAISATMIGDMIFDTFLSIVWVYCLALFIRGGDRKW